MTRIVRGGRTATLETWGLETVTSPDWLTESVGSVHLLEFGSPEAVWELRVKDFPAVVTMDAHGRSLHQEVADVSKTHLGEVAGKISPDDVMFLVNAIYFKGSWRDRFDPARTSAAAFEATGGSQQVQMMHRPDGEGKLRYGWTPTATVGELSYGNGAFVMTIVVPQGDVDAYAATLDTASWRALLAPMVERDYAVRLPKFKLEYKRELKEDLKALGMQTPFIPGGADFTRMSTVGNQLFIAFVQHKTFVDVNEEGTEAAAVTNVGVGIVSAPPCLCVDRPFLFAIRERFSGTILFLGKIVRIPG